MDIKLLKDILSIYGPSGREEKIRSFIKDEIKDYVDDIRVDALGNLIARKKGKGKKIMLASHMDQIGFMVIDIDKEGFLRLTNVGGIDPLVSIGQRVIFENGIEGVIFKDADVKDNLKVSDLYLDIGFSNRGDVERYISIGDICIYKENFLEGKNTIVSPYLDDRIACYLAIETIKNIKNSKNDLYFVFTVQEELGLRGARTSAYSINPDIGLAIDVTIAGDTPKMDRLPVELGKGVAIKIKDGSMISHKEIKDLLIDLAESNNIDHQLEILESAGTDAGAIHMVRKGVKTGAISIPTRYIHSPVEMISKKDIESTYELLNKFLNSKF